MAAATAVKPGLFSSWRMAKQRSFMNQFRKPKAEIRKEARSPKSESDRCDALTSVSESEFSFIRPSDFGFGFSFTSQRLHRIEFCGAPLRKQRVHRQCQQAHRHGSGGPAITSTDFSAFWIDCIRRATV